MAEKARSHESTHTVRPRWTWIALVVMFLGLVLIGIGIVVPSWAWVIPGLVLLAVGAVAGLYGGFFYDVQGGSSFAGQMKDVKEDTEFEFPGAGTMRSKSEVEHEVRERWLSDDE